MINLFRKIRKQLADENKPKKYLRYAIGEISLVVIGILIALQLNTWKIERVEAKQEMVYLQNLQRDLSEQIGWINTQVNYENQIIGYATSVLNKYKQEKRFIVDSVFIGSTSPLITRRTFISVNTTYISIISTGNIDLIKNPILKNELISYYEYLIRTVEIIKQNNLIIDNQISPFLSELVLLYEIVPEELISGASSNLITNNYMQYTEKLVSIANILLSKPEKELKLYNNLQSRRSISGINKSLLKEGVLVRTNELIESIEKSGLVR